MSIDAALVAEIAGGIVTVGTFLLGIAKWMDRRVANRIAKLEKERAESEKALRDSARDAEVRCREDNEDLKTRVRELEARSHKEGREDRAQLLAIVAQGAEANRQSAQATLQVGRALERVAQHLPDRTPPEGSKTA